MANKSLLIAGVVCILLALASFGIAWSESAEGIEDISSVSYMDYMEGPGTSFTYTLVDEDGQGSSGWYVMMEGEYKDDDGNGYTDDCENINFNVAEVRGDDVTDASSVLTCLYSEDEFEFSDKDYDPDIWDNKIIFGYVCATVDKETGYDCEVGQKYTITSETQLYIFDSDSYNIAFGESALGILGGLGIGAAGTCCCGLGGILLLVGLLTGGKPTPMVGYVPQQGMQQMGQMPQQGMPQQMGQMPVQQPQYTVGAGIDSSSVADTPVSLEGSPSSVWDSNP